MALPIAILFDLDDTLISAHLHPREAWTRALDTLDGRPDDLDTAIAAGEIHRAAKWFWSDPARHKQGRMDIVNARRRIVSEAFQALGRTEDDALINRIAAHFTAQRTRDTTLFPDAVDTLRTLREKGVTLGLITNGNADEQRAKVDRFDLARHFAHVQIEGEVGFGKPEKQAYTYALERLGTSVADTWIVGDNLEWEVTVPQSLGFYAVWRDPTGRGLPSDTTARPDRVISRLAELVDG